MAHRAIVVGHKLRSVQDADLILVMSNGTLVEQGTHADLLCAANSTYSRMWAQQRHGNERWFEQRGRPEWCPVPENEQRRAFSSDGRGPSPAHYGDVHAGRREYGVALQGLRDLAATDESLLATAGREAGDDSDFRDGGGWLW